jgi:hypothetical protein
MENTFKLTDEHTIMLDGMNDELKDTAKQIVNTLGYYQAISFFMTELELTEDKAKILADLACYVIDQTMSRTKEQMVKDNLLELERLNAIYIKVNDYAKQISGFSIFDLEALIEQAEQFNMMFNTDNWMDEEDPYCG